MPETGLLPPDKAGAATILVMEPDVLARLVIADYLRECGHKVVECASADDALTLLGSGLGIDMVLSSAHSPDGSEGFSLSHRIRVSHPHVHVVLTSSIENAASRAAEICGNGHLTKPLNAQEVVRRIRVLRERHRTST